TSASSRRFQRTSELAYDAFGNIVRTRVRVGVGADDFTYEYKTYDALGRLRHDVDALDHVTAFDYTVFGEQREVTRHSVTLAGAPANGELWTWAEVAAQVSGDAAARAMTMKYDAAGRKIEIRQPSVTGSYYFTDGAARNNPATVPQVTAQAVTAY